MEKTDSTQDIPRTLADLDRVIHEPARLSIMAVLSVVESADFIFLMRQTGLTSGNLSTHTTKLEAAGYIEISKEFVDKIPRTLIRLTAKGKEAFTSYRENVLKALGNIK